MKLLTKKHGLEHYTLMFQFVDVDGDHLMKLEAWSIEQLEVNLIKVIYKHGLHALHLDAEFRALKRKVVA